MKRILLSGMTLVVLTLVVVSATGAFFNDTETSTGNIFTAGTIDLKVDHTRQTYNGVDCATCDVMVQSDETNLVIGTVGGLDVGPFPHVAVAITPNPAWTAAVSNPNAEWIWWAETPVSEYEIDTQYTFTKTFDWWGPISGATLNLALASDNGYAVYLNGNLVGADPGEQNYNLAGQDSYSGAQIAPFIIQGENTLMFVVDNAARPSGQTWNNPGGLLYSFEIDGNCESDYFRNQCSLFGEKDLEVGDVFFNFDDIKPGDFGTNVISLHVYDNDAYACLVAHDGVSDENTVYETEGVDDNTKGELEDYLNVFTWSDSNGDGVYNPVDDVAFGTSTLGNLGAIASMDSINGEFLTATTTAYVGVAWCAGDITVDGLTGDITCDGSGANDNAQSDIFTASLTAYAEQVRNNGSFECSGVTIPPVI